MQTFTSHSIPRAVGLAFLALIPGFARPGWTKPISLRLVCADRPDTLVSEVETVEEKKPAEVEQADSKPRPPGRTVGWMRFITLDGQDAFKLTYKGAFLKRAASITADLSDGEHVIDPGGHRFTVRGGRIETRDRDLRSAGDGLDLLCHPVTFFAVDASVVRKKPIRLKSIPLNVVVKHGESMILPVTKTFNPLVLYMVSNPEGPPYQLIPTRQCFRVTADGVRTEDTEEAKAVLSGVAVENLFTVGIPCYSFPLHVTTRPGHKVGVKVYGFSGEGQFLTYSGDTQTLRGFYSRQGSQLRFGHGLPSESLPIEGDVAAFPHRLVRVDGREPGCDEPRGFVAAWNRQSFHSGEVLQLRVRVMDSADRPTLSPAEVAVFLRERPVLDEESRIHESAAPAAGETDSWTRLPCRQAPGQPIYQARLPVRPTNLYLFRLAVDRAGSASPSSFLSGDFYASLSSPDRSGTLSVFTDSLRTAYEAGETLEFNVVLKNRQPIDGLLEVVLAGEGGSTTLARKEAGSQPPGHHTWTFRIAPEGTAACSEGEFQIRATLGPLSSAPFRLHFRSPVPRTHFPIFSFPWGAGHHQRTVVKKRNDDPAAREQELRRNVQHLAHMNLNVLCTLEKLGFQLEGRDSESFHAVAEKMMREDAGLPASELVYNRTNYEILIDEMVRQGQRFFPQSWCGMMLSLFHSVPEDLSNTARTYALLAQDYRRFPNWIGFVAPTSHICVLGNSEVGDPRWEERMRTLAKNFRARYGHDQPREDQIIRWVRGDRSTRERLADVEVQWMRWIDTINGLLPGIYRDIRAGVGDLKPDLKLGAMTFQASDAESGDFITRMQEEQDVNLNSVGYGDYARLFPLEEIVETMLGRAGGPKTHQWRDIGDGSTSGRTNAKVQFFKSILSKVDGIGTFSYAGFELGMHPSSWYYDEYREFNRWLVEYGDWYQSLELESPLAVYLSYLDSAHDLGTVRHTAATPFIARGAVYELARAHRTAPMIADEFIRQDGLGRFRIVLLPAVRFVPDDVRARFEEFIRRGGVVLADEDTTAEIEGATRIPKHFQTMLHPYFVIGSQYDGNRIFWEAYQRTRPEVAKLNRILESAAPPFVSAPSSRVLTSTMRHGDARYVFVVNDEIPYWTEATHFGAQQFTLPIKTRVTVRDAESTVYSVLERKAVDGERTGEGRVLDVDLEFSGVQIYALLPRPIGSLQLTASGSVSPGQAIRVAAQVLDSAGQALRAAVPLELRLVDPAGRVVHEIYRTTRIEGYSESLPIGWDAVPGDWRLEARETFAGHRAAVEVAVGGDPAPLQASETGEVIVVEGARIRRFLEQLREKGQPLWILLGTDQSVALLPLARRLAEPLRQKGIRAEVRLLEDPKVVRPPGRVERLDPQSHVEQHVLLLGREGENALIEEIADTSILLRRFTRNYPGDGRALIEMALSPFSLDFHALLVLSPDLPGLEKGVSRLLDFDTLDREPDLLARAAAVESTAPLRASDGREAQPMRSRIEEEEGLPPSAIAFSPDGSHFAVGCHWTFSNLFLFERSGKLLWKKKVGRVEVNQVFLSPGAERLAVNTDLGSMLLDKSGRILWRMRQPVVMNAAGDLLFSAGADLTLALRPDGSALWVNDPWLEETDPWRMNDSNNLSEIAFLCDQKTLLLRHGARIEFRDAAANRALSDFVPEALLSSGPDDPPRWRSFRGEKLRVTPDGQFIGMVYAQGEQDRESYGRPIILPYAFVFRRGGQIAQKGFLPPPYFADFHSTDNLWISPDGTLFVLCKDTVYRVRPDGTAAWQYSFRRPLVSGGALSPDGRRLALASWGRRLVLLDAATGQPLWEKPLESGAEVAFSPDGQVLVAGGKTGVVAGYNLQGDVLFQSDLRRDSFIPGIEEFWANQDAAVPELQYGKNPPWHETVRRDVPLSPNLLSLPEMPYTLAEAVELTLPGERFGTYLLTLKYRAREGKAGFHVRIQEQDAEEALHEIRSGSFEARPFLSGHHSVFKLSDRPARIHVRLENEAGGSEVILEDFRLEKLQYPSENYLYHRGGYALGKTQEVMDNAPVSAAIYHMQWGSHSTVEVDPFYLMDGRVFKPQKELDDGWWFGGGAGSQASRNKITPCAIDFEFPEPKPISHIVLFDDEDGEPVERVAFQAWVEARDLRLNKTEREERQIRPGYWRTVGKARWNDAPFQVFRFENLVTDKIRFWYLRGPLKLDEVEIYGPEKPKTTDWHDKAWIARIPVKVNRVTELAEVEFQPLGLTRADGADLRVINPMGQEVPYVLKQLVPSGNSVLVMDTRASTGTYFIYLGNETAEAPSYDWRPEGGIWMESYERPSPIDGEDSRVIYNEAQLFRFFRVARDQALEAWKKARSEGKSYGGARIGFVRAVGYDALPNSITRYSFTLETPEPRRLSFRAGVSSEMVASLLKVNDQVVFGGWNAWEPGKAPTGWAAMPGKHWGDAELQAGVNRFEFTYVAYPANPLTFRPAEGRAERYLLTSRYTSFPGARRLLPESIQTLSEQGLGDFYRDRAERAIEQDRLFDAQEMLLYAVNFLKDPQARSQAKLLAAQVSDRIAASNWAQFRGGPARTGCAKLSPRPGEKDIPVNPGPFARVAASESFEEQVEGGIAATDLGVFFGTCTHNIHRFGGWYFTTSGIIRGTPLVYGQRIYCGSMDGHLYCLAAGLGELVWKFPTGDGIAASPLLVDDHLLFGSLDGYLYALDPLTGQSLWKYRSDGWIESSPATDGRLVFFGSYDDHLHAVNLHTGKLAWKFQTQHDIASTPCVDGGVVFFGSDDGHVYALKASDGSLLWKTRASEAFLPSSPALAQGVLVIGSTDGHVYALDAATGGIRWKYATEGGVEASPIIVGDLVVVPSNDNHLYAFRLVDGTLLARNAFGGNPSTRSLRCSPAYLRESLWLGGTTDIKAGQVQRWER
ncbi:MAG: PQQ-binding-like beta-propeller repeat protein [Planctomycetes bacterium]|nr:PQQ-binding-like beta-propeller repeat protein [Planctomycetota bacterium]